MEGVGHHGVVDQNDAHTLTKAELRGFGAHKVDAVDGPHVAVHVAGEVQLYLSARLAFIPVGCRL